MASAAQRSPAIRSARPPRRIAEQLVRVSEYRRYPQGGYDSINRLRQYQRGVLSNGSGGAVAGGSVTTPISLPGADKSRDYVLDGLGNWKKTTFDPVGGSETTQVRQHNGLNEITRTDDGTTKINFEYDGVASASNGNLADDGVRTYKWDALNRLKEVRRVSDNAIIGEYTYDALNRRVKKVISNGGLSGTIPNGTTRYLYNSDWQCLEERNGSNSVTKQYVWGEYVDKLIQQKQTTTINGNAAGEYYPLQDTLYRTLALTDDTGAIVETYDYDPYGNTLIFTAPGTGSDWWADDATQGNNPTCEHLFVGRRYDSETTLYLYRRRFYLPTLARFLGRDPINYEDGLNLYCYVSGMPVSLLDPSGRDRYITQMKWSNIHVGVAVDTWRRNEKGEWVSTGQATFHFAPNATSRWCTNLLFAPLLADGDVVQVPGIQLFGPYITFKSSPYEDVIMYDILSRQVKNPPDYSLITMNCVMWSVVAIHLGIKAQGPASFNSKMPIGPPEVQEKEMERFLESLPPAKREAFENGEWAPTQEAIDSGKLPPPPAWDEWLPAQAPPVQQPPFAN